MHVLNLLLNNWNSNVSWTTIITKPHKKVLYTMIPKHWFTVFFDAELKCELQKMICYVGLK